MSALIKEKAQHYIKISEDKVKTVSLLENEFNSKEQGFELRAREISLEFLKIVSYPLAACKLFYAHQLPISESWLSLIRSLLVKMLQYEELVFSHHLDNSFSEILERVKILDLTLEEQLLYLQKTSLILEDLRNFSESHSKIRFVWIDLIERIVKVMKNSLDYSQLAKNLNPTSPQYETAFSVYFLIKEALSKAAESLRNRYELKNQQGDDLEKAIVFLEILKRILGLTRNSQEVNTLIRKQEVWKAKLKADRLKLKDL